MGGNSIPTQRKEGERGAVPVVCQYGGHKVAHIGSYWQFGQCCKKEGNHL